MTTIGEAVITSLILIAATEEIDGKSCYFFKMPPSAGSSRVEKSWFGGCIFVIAARFMCVDLYVHVDLSTSAEEILPTWNFKHSLSGQVFIKVEWWYGSHGKVDTSN